MELRRRFYRDVDWAPAEGGFAVRLDKRTPRSPLGRPLVLPNERLARLCAEEWEMQGEHIRPASMPATRLAWTAIDRAADARAGLAAELARYAGADLLCYFADGPDELVRRQAVQWGPLIEWAETTLGVTFRRAQGISHRPQPEATLRRLEQLAGESCDFTLTGLVFGAGLFGSAVLAFAVCRAALDGEAAFGLSRLDEAFQEERWGVDAEAAERTEARAAEARMLGRWFEALR
ncbi:MAG: ATPase [Caulobacteraceae bacterium]|nr:ATPase [Caulobacteraceae bacterium]